MKYDVIDKAKRDYPVRRLCEFLGVSESGYYAWGKREPSQCDSQDGKLKGMIMGIWHGSHQIYGLPRIDVELRERGIQIGKQRLARLMREAGVQGKTPRRKHPQTTKSDPKPTC